MGERGKFLFKKKERKTCSSRRSCKVCNRKHLTTLYGYFRKKTTINNDKGLVDDEKIKGM